MNDFHGLLSSDFGFKPQGKSAPMAPPKPNSTANSGFNFEIGGSTTVEPTSLSKSSSGSFIDDHDTFHRPSNDNRKSQEFSDLGGFENIFGGGNSKPAGNSSVNFDSIFSGSADSGAKFSSLPVFDKPVYDDDALDGVSGSKSSNSAKYQDIFTSLSKKSDAFDDLLGGFGRKEPEAKGSGAHGTGEGTPSFDDLLPGFGGNTAQSERTTLDSSWHQRSTASATKKTSSAMDDPFVVLESSSSSAPSSSGLFADPIEQISNLNSSSTKKVESSASGGVFDGIDSLEGLGKSVPAFVSDREKDGSPLRAERRTAGRQNSANIESSDKSYGRSPDRVPEKKMHADDYQGSARNVFDMPSVSADSHRYFPNAPPLASANASFVETNAQEDMSPRYEENSDSSEDIWLTVSEIPLFTQPTAAPPPSRPPPPRPPRFSRVGAASQAKRKVDEYSAFPSSNPFYQSPRSAPAGAKSSFISPIDELEDFAMGKSQNNADGSSDVLTGEDTETNSVAAASAAAMKEAMDRAEAKFRHAKEVRERENAKAARMQQERGEKTAQDAQEREYRERQEWLEHGRQQREREEEARRQREEEERRRIEKERDEKEREQRRERERELARQAVERATREARERAAAEARVRAERAAVGKAQAEARERAERAAVQRVQAEARERAAREAKEKAEARERAKAEAREKEARERAAAAAAAKANQQKNENDIESFFSMGSRPSSAPRPRANSSDTVFESQFQSKQAQESVRTSVGSTSGMRKASSSANIVDDLSSIFGAPPSSGEFQEVEGESEERRRARMERHQRTQERAAKALAEKNQRDLQAQREQAERHRIAETLDAEIKRWAAGKEGNLRALLSTLQYVLWPECGWQPVSLTDLITAASVKKVYRKATLYIHPDKVQQKGATLQQKYVAEKVFDLLKEAWNKFNSEELF
ncbi:hypothetical protein Ancab_024361 [Ancistrocladus abbreviatus]